MMSRSAVRCAGPMAFMSAAWTRSPCAVSAAWSVRAKPQVEPPSLPTRMTVSADRTGAFAGSRRLCADACRSHITKPVAPSAGTAAVVSPSASARTQAPRPVWSK